MTLYFQQGFNWKEEWSSSCTIQDRPYTAGKLPTCFRGVGNSHWWEKGSSDLTRELWGSPSSFSPYGLRKPFGIYMNKTVFTCKMITVKGPKCLCVSGRGRVCWHPELVFLLCQILIMLKRVETLPQTSAGRWLLWEGLALCKNAVAHSGLAVALQSPFYRCFLFISKSI